MKARRGIPTSLGAMFVVLAVTFAGVGASAAAGPRDAGPTYGSGSAKITNRFLPISDFRRCELRGKDGAQRLGIIRELKADPKVIRFGGRRVKAAVVRDTVTNLRSNRKIEQTFDYFAQDRRGGVHYLGEDVDEYLPDGSVSHEGQWRAGRDGARAGLLMPARPTVGRRFKSENARGIAVEKDTVVAKGGTETVRGQTYEHVMKIREHATTPKPAEFESKTYAPGVGVITEADGGVGLVGCSG